MIEQLVLVFVVTFFLGAITTIVGGISLITVPLLILLGLPPVQAIATNRAGLLGMAPGGLFVMNKHHLVDWKLGAFLASFAIVGSFFGARLVLELSQDLIQKIVAVITVVMLVFLLLKHDFGIKNRKVKRTPLVWGVGAAIAFVLGIYGGFYGAGFGTFMTYLLIFVFGETFLQSAGTRKIVGFTMTVAATIVFVLAGVVVWPFALAFMAGAFLGGIVGTTYGIKAGNTWIKYFFAGAVVVMAASLFF